MNDASTAPLEAQQRLRAGRIALGAGLVILAAKAVAFAVTGSIALKSDALESSINCPAAAVALWALKEANVPPDREHPYGHGKIEHATAAFKGV
jgi:divalent metal cation (Fe/Co/Zn/Cd) transporter